MTDEKFKEVIYKPYLETWKVLKLLQHAYKRLDDPELDKANDAIWEQFKREAIRLEKTYPGNPFVAELLKLLFTADEVISRMNQEGLKDDQT